MYCVSFIILAADSQELDFIHPPTLAHKYTVADTQHKFSRRKHIQSLTYILTQKCSLAHSFTHIQYMCTHTHTKLILSALHCNTVGANQATSRGSRQWARCCWLAATFTKSCLTLYIQRSRKSDLVTLWDPDLITVFVSFVNERSR